MSAALGKPAAGRRVSIQPALGLWLLVLGAAANPALGPRDARAAEARPDLTGSWVLDAARSDDPGAVLREEPRDASGSRGGALSRVARGVVIFGIPVGSLPLPGGGSSRSTEAAEAIVDVDYALRQVSELRILQQGDATQLEYGRRLVSFEHGAVTETAHGTVRADWDGDEFKVDHELDDGTKVVETYRFDAATDRLHWDLSLKRKRSKAVDISRIYERRDARGLNFAALDP